MFSGMVLLNRGSTGCGVGSLSRWSGASGRGEILAGRSCMSWSCRDLVRSSKAGHRLGAGFHRLRKCCFLHAGVDDLRGDDEEMTKKRLEMPKTPMKSRGLG